MQNKETILPHEQAGKLRKLLSDSQIALEEKTRIIGHLQAELEDKQEELDSVNADIEIRNKIIEEIEKRLEGKQIVPLDENKASSEDGFHDPYEQEYYNLKQQFSQLDEENIELKINPNPARQNLNVNINSIKPAKAELTILNVTGNIVYKKK